MKTNAMMVAMLLLIPSIRLFAQDHNPTAQQADFLIDPSPFVTVVLAGTLRAPEDGERSLELAQLLRNGVRELSLENGLIRRTWRLAPNGACVAFDNLMTGQSMLRSVRPEARLTIDDQAYVVGGLVGQPNQAFLTPQWLEQLQADPAALQLVDICIAQPRERSPGT